MSRPYTRGQLTVHNEPSTVAKVCRALRSTGRSVVLVPTMGALHEGHRELLRAARRSPNAIPVVSIFVNPLQFGAGEDLDRYPRTLEADLEMCRAEGVELVFVPGPADMYPEGADTTVHPGALGEQLEGESRPGHFAGVLTVVLKLFNLIRPHTAFFGQKDYQQLVLIRRMVRDLNLDVRVTGVQTVREPSGLALSSRNAYLSESERRSAAALSAALAAGAHAGPHGPDAVLMAAGAVLAAEPGLELDYLELRSPGLGRTPDHGDARLLVAARVGGTRLIDNFPVLLGDQGDRAHGMGQ